MPRRNPKRLPPKAGWAIYLRTSSQDAQNPIMSQERQRFNIQRNLLENSELSIVGEYVDEMSGRTPKRAGYQRLLDHARAGSFSHVAVENAERFGRNDTEALSAIDELHKLGVAVRFADYPDLDPIDADDRLLIAISFTLARRESIKLGQRVQGGQHAKCRNGGHASLAPDGYRNVERRATDPTRTRLGRYERWIEADPQQFKVWRVAWDLLLEDRLTLTEICEELHARGFRYRSGRPFIDLRNGRRIPATNTLSKHFHNWFYAGWVVSEKAGIPPKTIRGHWKPLVTTEEFERGVEILIRRNRYRLAKRRHTYLLKGMIFIEDAESAQLVKLTGSTSNVNRKGGGTPYYCIWGSNVNIRCTIVDAQVADRIRQIQVNPDLIHVIREAYTRDIAEKLGQLRPTEQQQLQTARKAVDEEEARTARLYAAGKISDQVWDSLWQEWQDKRRAIQISLDGLNRKHEAHIADLDAALTIIAKVGILYVNLDQDSQREVLREMVDRVVVDRAGNIVRMDLLPPFGYLNRLTNRLRQEANSEGVQRIKNSGLDTAAAQCSGLTTSGGPEEIRTPDLVSAIDALSQLSYRP